MFGGIGIYHDGLMFGLVADGEIFLKSDAETVSAFRDAGSHPFGFERQGRRTETSYWRAPEQALDMPDEMKRWADMAYSAALRARSTKGTR